MNPLWITKIGVTRDWTRWNMGWGRWQVCCSSQYYTFLPLQQPISHCLAFPILMPITRKESQILGQRRWDRSDWYRRLRAWGEHWKSIKLQVDWCFRWVTGIEEVLILKMCSRQSWFRCWPVDLGQWSRQCLQGSQDLQLGGSRNPQLTLQQRVGW